MQGRRSVLVFDSGSRLSLTIDSELASPGLARIRFPAREHCDNARHLSAMEPDMSDEFDLLVMGSGPDGAAASRRAATGVTS